MNRFIIAGQPRAGTTFLYHNLQKHPSIFMASRKEINYFTANYERGAEWFDHWYRDMASDQIGGDVSPGYFLQSQAIERIRAYDPNVKIILAVREPADWAVSLHGHVQTFDWRVPHFAEFIDGYAFKIAHTRSQVRIAGGFVAGMIEKYRAAFGDDILLFDFELLRRNPLYILRCITRFLELPPSFDDGNFDNFVINAGRRPNLKLLTTILTNEKFRSFVEAFVPQALIQRTRNWTAVIGGKLTAQKTQSIDPETSRIAREAFAADSEAVSALFAESKMQLGSGKPFTLDCSGVSEDRTDAMSHPNERQDPVTAKC